MITYSSNANTDYLINKLGIDSINARAAALGISQHEDVYQLSAPSSFQAIFKREIGTRKN